jgi:hypothetical protein
MALVVIGSAGVAMYLAMAGAFSELGELAASLTARDPAVHAAPSQSSALAPSDLAPARVEQPAVPIPIAEPPRLPAASETLDEEHRPAEQAVQTFIVDELVFRTRLETLLVGDPEALEHVRALLNEKDPNIRAENLRLLQDTFAIE